MLTFLASSIGKYVIIGLFAILFIGGAVFYVDHLNNKIATLSEQIVAIDLKAKSLQAANDSMSNDIKSIQNAQADALSKINDIRTTAQTQSQIQKTKITEQIKKSTPSNLQNSVNIDTAAALKGLEDLTK